MSPSYASRPTRNPADDLRLEAVTVCVGFDDFLDETLRQNHPHLDTMIVVTSHDDARTQAVARKHGATVVATDLHKKNQRDFNKGAAINAGFDYFQYEGWRLHLDADIVLPSDFRRVLFNHASLDRDHLYGADRVDVVGRGELEVVRKHSQHRDSMFVSSALGRAPSVRFVDPLRGYLPLGYFQLWHASCQKPYPYSLGTAAHDDLMFSATWPESRRQLLPHALVYHLCSAPPRMGENWNGVRGQPRLGGEA